MGPKSRELLSRVSKADLSNEAYPFGTSQLIDIGFFTVRATRLTYVGELGWELYVPAEFANGVFDLLHEAGGRRGGDRALQRHGELEAGDVFVCQGSSY
jgi:4-methylaminobutanoate oxidase (formaldehyde-forming)